MKQQTIYFLQALWDTEPEKDQITGIGREALCKEMDRAFAGVLHEETIWVSARAGQMKQRIAQIRMDASQAMRPSQLLRINQDFLTVLGEIQAMQLQTMQALNAGAGPVPAQIHILARQIRPFAIRRIREQCMYQMYRLLVLKGGWPDPGTELPDGESSPEWIPFFLDKLCQLLAQQKKETLDGRWAYERRQVSLGGIRLEQFIRVTPRREEIRQMIGQPGIGSGKNGCLRFFGRGAITNIAPEDMLKYYKSGYVRNLSFVSNMTLADKENAAPTQVLERILGRKKYLIAPEDYFKLINKYIIAETFNQRVGIGKCLYCGSTLYHGRCPECGR